MRNVYAKKTKIKIIEMLHGALKVILKKPFGFYRGLCKVEK
jgi:hypothetical protein